MTRILLLAFPFLCSALLPALAHAQQWPLPAARYEVEGRRSGYFYLGRQTQVLQDDDFQNPGVFAVDAGAALWRKVEGEAGLSCASCHDNAAVTMKGVSSRYPRFDAAKGGIINLELMINREREQRMKAPPLPYESEQLIGLTAYIGYQSRGLPRDIDVAGPAAPFFEKGREFFFQRRGLTDISCAMCHDNLAGALLRGDVVSQGQINGFPFYRLQWRSMGSSHRMFEWCNTSMRAEPYPYGGEEYLNLELYVAWRGRGLPVETPAVRR